MATFRGLTGRFLAIAGAVLLFGGSLTTANAQSTTTLLPPTASAVDGNGVDLISGNLTMNIPGLSAGGGGSGISRLGSGYNLPYGDNLSGVVNGTAGVKLTISLGGGSEAFTFSGTVGTVTTYVPTDNTGGTLTCDSATNSCDYTTGDGALVKIDTTLTSDLGIRADAGAVVSITNPDGEKLTYVYKRGTMVGGILHAMSAVSVSSSNGWMVRYDLPTGTDQIVYYIPTAIYIINTSLSWCSPTGDAISSSNCDLTLKNDWPTMKVITSGGQVTYERENHDPLVTGLPYKLTTGVTGLYVMFPKSIETPEHVTISATFSGSSSTATSVTRGGQTWLYNHSASSATVTDPLGGKRSVTFDAATSHLLTDTDEMGRTVTYTYYAITDTPNGKLKNRIWQVIAPDATYSGATLTGGYSEYKYDARGNVTSISTVPKGGGTALTQSATYASTCTNAKTCNKPLTVTDAAGVTTTYTYNSSNGAVDTITLPAPDGTHPAPKTNYTYTQFTPKTIIASGGSPVNSLPIWRLTQVTACQSLTSCNSGGSLADQLKTTYDYTGNNVFLTTTIAQRGDANPANPASATNRYHKTVITYDNMGKVTNIQGPIQSAAASTYYLYDGFDRQVGVIGADPDAGGSLPRQAVKTEYDNDSRVVKSTQGYVTGTNMTALNAITPAGSATTAYNSASLPSV